MVVPSLDVTVEMSSETENNDSNTDVIRQSIVAVNGIEYDLIERTFLNWCKLFLLSNLVGTDFVMCDGLWNLGDLNAASFPDVKTPESAGFENYEDGCRLLIELEKKIIS